MENSSRLLNTFNAGVYDVAFKMASLTNVWKRSSQTVVHPFPAVVKSYHPCTTPFTYISVIFILSTSANIKYICQVNCNLFPLCEIDTRMCSKLQFNNRHFWNAVFTFSTFCQVSTIFHVLLIYFRLSKTVRMMPTLCTHCISISISS